MYLLETRIIYHFSFRRIYDLWHEHKNNFKDLHVKHLCRLVHEYLWAVSLKLEWPWHLYNQSRDELYQMVNKTYQLGISIFQMVKKHLRFTFIVNYFLQYFDQVALYDVPGTCINLYRSLDVHKGLGSADHKLRFMHLFSIPYSRSYGSRIRPLSRYRVIALSTCAQRDNATTR